MCGVVEFGLSEVVSCHVPAYAWASLGETAQTLQF